MSGTTIFSHLLDELQVPHTARFSDKAYRDMSFKSLFGFSRLLGQHGVDSEGYMLDDRSQIDRLPVPFMARSSTGFVVVKRLGDKSVDLVRDDGTAATVDRSQFDSRWRGEVLLVFPHQNACEPDYSAHRRDCLLRTAKRYLLIASVAFLVVYSFIVNGLWRDVSAWFLTLLDCFGLYITYLLLLKQLNIRSASAERVCGILQQGGCNSVLASEASSFFGIFHWSEVGFAYFGVSLATMLAFPSMLPQLALVNVCCLPYTVWSIWYQRFRAKAWCTLCVTVQTSLWLLFFCYLGGGWLAEALPLRPSLLPLGAAYLSVLFGLNAVTPRLSTPE